MTTSQVKLQQAFEFYEQGQLAQTKSVCEELLMTEPACADALHLLGIIDYQANHHQRAIDLFNRAIAAEPDRPAFYANRGNALLALSLFDEAVKNYDQALAINPNLPDAHFNRGNALQALNQLEAAIDSYSQAITINPNFAQAFSNCGNALQALKRFNAALENYDQAISIKPDYTAAYFNRGMLLKELNQLEKAIENFNCALAIEADSAETYFNRGNIFYELKNFEAALADYNQALSIKSDYVDAYLNRGLVLQELNQPEAAIENYNRAITIKSDFAEAYFNRGNLLQKLNRFQEAVDSYHHAITIKSDYFEAFVSCGSALADLQQYESAVENYNQAIKINPDVADVFVKRGFALHQLNQLDAATADFDHAIVINPDYALAHYNRGNIFLQTKQFEAAVAKYDTAITSNPDFAEAYHNRGSALLALKQKQAAIESFDSAIACQSDFADAYNYKALTLLSMGEFEKGWELLEWRSKLEKYEFSHFKMTNEWKGESLTGSLLVLPEQGIGDEIFFSGMLSDLSSVADNITVCINTRLIPLYQRSFEHIKFISRQLPQDVKQYDKQVFMGSLGRYFRANQSALQNVKSPYLKACPNKTKKLRGLFTGDKKLICGLSWISKNAYVGTEKTLLLQDLKSVLSLPDIEFVDLQYGDTNEEQSAFFDETGIKLTRVSEIDNFNDMDGLASLIDACDIVLSVSNTTAHLAGALGKPLIVMLSEGRGLMWYWHDGTGISPWYPSARLVKQNSIGDWASVVEQVKALLIKVSRP